MEELTDTISVNWYLQDLSLCGATVLNNRRMYNVGVV